VTTASQLTRTHTALGLFAAVGASLSFGISGPFARGLIEAGWSPDAAVLARIWIAALVLLIPTLWTLRGKWRAVRDNLGTLLAFGLLAVLGTQFCYFHAVERMDVGLALLIQFTAPIVILLWLWMRRGERPSKPSIVGAVVAFGGLVLMLDILTGARVDAIGVLWALGGMTGTVIFFLVSARHDTGIPPIAFAGLGLLIGAVAISILGLAGILPFTWNTNDVSFLFGTTPWYLPVIVIGVVSAGLAFALSVIGVRILGSRLASFIAILEVVVAMFFAWLLLGQLPEAIQLVGGVLVLGGIIVVKLGEPEPEIEVVRADTGGITLPPHS
jgi:drug/metabolite transporter (DMT)-like permease